MDKFLVKLNLNADCDSKLILRGVSSGVEQTSISVIFKFGNLNFGLDEICS
jgi:hypothetical protein